VFLVLETSHKSPISHHLERNIPFEEEVARIFQEYELSSLEGRVRSPLKYIGACAAPSGIRRESNLDWTVDRTIG
jgi:hypothetical protein